MPNEAHIIVGCGGSGLKTLRRLNELLSQDYYWRRRLDNDIYYVIVDTDVNEMREFEAAVMRDLAGVPDKPYITAIQLSRGETHLQPLVNESMVEPFAGGRNDQDRERLRKEQGRQRLLEHWWNRGPDAPFVAPKVIPVTEGAGQCPPVSYFLTWKKLENLQRDFKSLIEAIERRQGGFGKMDVLNFVIVAGLAGGTGRGSWELIAFKLREMFRRYGKTPKPRAFLFDASVFDDIFEANAEQEVPMRVNALTGVSELSCWVENKLTGHQNPSEAYCYHLPSMSNPEAPEADILQADLYVDRNDAAPVNHAYLIFDDNTVSKLSGHRQYCEMVGAGIYAALSKSSINREEINSGESYVGLATGTCEVNAATVRRYFEAQAQVYATNMLMRLEPEKVKLRVEEFLEKTRLRIDVTDENPGEFFCPEPDGLLLQKVLARLEDELGSELSALDTAMENDDIEETARLVGSVLSENEDLVCQCFDRVIRGEQLDPYAQAEALAKDLFQDTKSVRNVEEFVARVKAALDEELTEMPAEMHWADRDPQRLVEQYASRPLPMFFPYFNQAERDHLRDVTRQGIAKANYQVLKREIGERYTEWSRQIGKLGDNAAEMATCFQKLERKFERERERTVPEHDNAFQHLFADPEEPEKALPTRFGAKKFYRRELKPVLTRQEEQGLLEERVELTKELFEVTYAALLRDREADEGDAFDRRKQLARNVEKAIRESVGLSDRFISDQFSIRRVIEKLRTVWRKRLQKAMRSDVRAGLEEHFAELFGFIPKRQEAGDEIDYDFPTIDECILHMGASMARTCKPYWKLKSDRGAPWKVALFVPVEMDVADAKDMVGSFLDDPSVAVEVFQQLQTTDSAAGSTANPFVMLAYSTRGTQEVMNIESLDYYTMRDVFDLVKGTENEDGATIFDGGKNGGLGYVDPLYVKNDTIRDMRWRPWVGDEEGAATSFEEVQTLDALLYALFPGDTKDSPRLQEIQKQLEERNWKMPLIWNKGRNRYELTRLPLKLIDGQGCTDQMTQNVPGWDVNKPVAPHAGIHHVWLTLRGQGDNPKPEWRQRILRECDLFWKRVLPGINLAEGTPVHREMLEEYVRWIAANARAVAADDPNKEVWQKLLSRVSQMAQA